MISSASDARRPERARINWWLVSWRMFQVMGVALVLAQGIASKVISDQHANCYNTAHHHRGIEFWFAVNVSSAVFACVMACIWFAFDGIPAWRRKAGL